MSLSVDPAALGLPDEGAPIVEPEPPPFASFERSRTALVFEGEGAAALIERLHAQLDATGGAFLGVGDGGVQITLVTVPKAAQPEDPAAPRVATSFVRVEGRG